MMYAAERRLREEAGSIDYHGQGFLMARPVRHAAAGLDGLLTMAAAMLVCGLAGSIVVFIR